MTTSMEPYLNKEQMEAQQKAQILIEALPYIQKFNRKIIVVKYGGSAMSDEELQRSVIQDVTLLKLVGFKPIIVHGGGKAISSWVKKSGKEAKFINGLRVTDAETCEIAEMVLGSVSKKLVSMVAELGIRAVGISGKDGNLLHVKKKYADGQVTGVLRSLDEPDSLISRININEANELVREGIVGGGMLPKLANCTDAVRGGVHRVHILDGRIPHCLLLEIFTDRGIGTVFYKGDYNAERGY